MTPQQVQFLQQSFGQTKGAEYSSASTLAEWLISGQHISRFQANMLLARQPGPFVFGDYKVYDRVESGRLTGLFRAVHMGTNHPVCLMFLAGPAAQDPQRLARVQKTASIYNGLRHNHLLRVYHFWDLQTHKFLVLENLYGQSLAELLQSQGGVLPSTEACRIAWQTALGLIHLEEHRMVHGEMRPQNLWINHLGTVKLLDFPLHRDPLSDPEPLDESAASNPNGRFARLADYLAPEVAKNRGQMDMRSEIYALGCILYQALTGRVPFPEEHVFRKVLRHSTENVTPANQLNPQVPPAVAQLVMYLLAKDPGQRYQRAAHVAEALAPYVEPGKLTTHAEPPTQQLQAYEAWLTQAFPASAPDPGTGEFNFAVKPEDAARFQSSAAAPPPGFPNFNQQTQSPAGGTPRPQAVGAAGQGTPRPTPMPQQNQQSEFPNFQVNETSVAASRKKKPSAQDEEAFERKAVQWAVFAGGAVVMLLLGLVVFNQLNSKPEPTEAVAENTAENTDTSSGDPKTTRTSTTKNLGANTRPNPQPSQPNPVADSEWDEMFDDRGQLWASPLTGEPEPLDATHLPSGDTKVIISLRPAAFLQDAEGQRVWKALGPWGKIAKQEIEALSGTTLENLDQVLIGLLPNGENPPLIATVARPVAPVPQQAVLQSWGQPTKESLKGRDIYVGNGRAYYVSSVSGSQVIATAPEEYKEDLLGEYEPLLRRESAQLKEMSDRRYHCCVLFEGQFPFLSGRAMLNTPRGRDLVEGFKAVLQTGPNEYIQSGLLNLHLGNEYFYAELKAHGGVEIPPTKLSRDLRDSFLQVPLNVYHFYKPPSEGEFGFVPSDDTRQLLARFPKMLDAWAAYLTRGTERKVAVLTSVLPRKAAHNLALSTQLAIRDPGIDLSELGPKTKEPETLEEKLTMIKIPLVIERDSLDRVLDQISQDYDIPIRILGPDLQLEGITKNQSFGLDFAEPQSIEKILQEILYRANPDKTSPGIGDPKQKLVYVYNDDKSEVIVTTRAKAWERGTPDPAFKVEKP